MVLIPPPPVVTKQQANDDGDGSFQETLDLYMLKARCRIIVLRAHQCGRKVNCTISRCGELSKKQIDNLPYAKSIMSMQREGRITRRRLKASKKGFINKLQYIYPGMPCSFCLQLVTIGSKCVLRRRVNTKIYHYKCARSINVI
jgi:hypothetical protein